MVLRARGQKVEEYMWGLRQSDTSSALKIKTDCYFKAKIWSHKYNPFIYLMERTSPPIGDECDYRLSVKHELEEWIKYQQEKDQVGGISRYNDLGNFQTHKVYSISWKKLMYWNSYKFKGALYRGSLYNGRSELVQSSTYGPGRRTP